MYHGNYWLSFAPQKHESNILEHLFYLLISDMLFCYVGVHLKERLL